jgi:mycothiol synthase
VLRPFDRDRELGALLSVMRQAFRGHWGYIQRPLADDVSEYQHLLENGPNVDPSLWFVAKACTQESRDAQEGAAASSMEIVGTCLGHPAMAGDPELAYIWGLGVLRSWRRRGVGLALLQHTFRALASRGKRRVTLFVDAGAAPDAGNPTGATRIYEKAGMHVQRQALFFEKELRAGRPVQ